MTAVTAIASVTWRCVRGRVGERRQVNERSQLRDDAGAGDGRRAWLQLRGNPLGQRLEQQRGGLGHLLAGARVIAMRRFPSPTRGTVRHGNARLYLPQSHPLSTGHVLIFIAMYSPQLTC